MNVDELVYIWKYLLKITIEYWVKIHNWWFLWKVKKRYTCINLLHKEGAATIVIPAWTRYERILHYTLTWIAKYLSDYLRNVNMKFLYITKIELQRNELSRSLRSPYLRGKATCNQDCWPLLMWSLACYQSSSI